MPMCSAWFDISSQSPSSLLVLYREFKSAWTKPLYPSDNEIKPLYVLIILCRSKSSSVIRKIFKYVVDLVAGDR